jgi:hypothetical protein
VAVVRSPRKTGVAVEPHARVMQVTVLITATDLPHSLASRLSIRATLGSSR